MISYLENLKKNFHSRKRKFMDNDIYLQLVHLTCSEIPGFFGLVRVKMETKLHILEEVWKLNLRGNKRNNILNN